LLNDLLLSAKNKGIICIADEVMTGFYRTGRFFASEYMEQKPDIICLSKGLTGGTMALGITACTNNIYQAYVTEDKYKTFFHGHSFTANPLACTAALASLDLLEKETCIEQIKWITNENTGFALKLSSRPWKIKNLRILGTILAFELDNGNDEYLNSISAVFTHTAISKGIYLRPLGNTVYLMPPYCITKEELSKIYSGIESILAELPVEYP